MRGASVVGVWSRWQLHADAVVEVLGSHGLRAVVVDDPWTHPGVLVAEAVLSEDVALVAQRAKGEHPTVVWGGTLPVPKVAALRAAGAAAYVPMLEHPRELVGVVTDVVAGVAVAWGELRLPKSGLTARERTVARAYLVEHAEWRRSQVAKHLGMSENTLKVHIANIRTSTTAPVRRRNRHVSKDITTAGPSRRSIAKGAAWAVPAVSVAAAAPSLAASPLPACTGADLSLTVESCSLVGLLTPEARFRISNPAGSGCTVAAGTPVSLTGGALASVGVAGLDDINIGVLDFTGVNEATLLEELAPGESVVVNVFPAGLNVNVLGTYTLSVLGASAEFTLAAEVGTLLEVCTSPND